jgi:tetratricopeptide (TPR) repeat protein
MGRLDLAGRVLLNLSLVEPEQQDHWREVAADFFALSGGKDRAITMYMKLAEKANDEKKRDREVALLEKAAMLAHDTGDAKTTAEIEGKYTAQGIEPQASRLVVEQAEASLERGDLTSAFNTSKRIISRDELPKDLLARARFVQARVLEDEYVKQSVKAKVERLGMVLAIKTEKLEKAQKAYQSAIHYGDPQTSIKALRRLAGCYLDYAKTVRAMGLPEGTSAQDQKAFKDEIEQLSIPMEEKGIESMAQALEASKKAQAHDGQVAELQAEVDRLNMKTSTPINVQVDMPGIYLPHFAVSAQKEAKR